MNTYIFNVFDEDYTSLWIEARSEKEAVTKFKEENQQIADCKFEVIKIDEIIEVE